MPPTQLGMFPCGDGTFVDNRAVGDEAYDCATGRDELVKFASTTEVDPVLQTKSGNQFQIKFIPQLVLILSHSFLLNFKLKVIV